MEEQFRCIEHQGEYLTNICVAQHDCSKKLCPVCVFNSHSNITNDQIFPKKHFQKILTEVIKNKEEQINIHLNDKQNWNKLLKLIDQQFQIFLKEITSNKDFFFQKLQEQLNILCDLKKEVESRSIFSFSNKEISNMIKVINFSKSQTQQTNDEEIQYALSVVNRKDIEKKIYNLCSEIRTLVKPFLNNASDEHIIFALKRNIFKQNSQAQLAQIASGISLQQGAFQKKSLPLRPDFTGRSKEENHNQNIKKEISPDSDIRIGRKEKSQLKKIIKSPSNSPISRENKFRISFNLQVNQKKDVRQISLDEQNFLQKKKS